MTTTVVGYAFPAPRTVDRERFRIELRRAAGTLGVDLLRVYVDEPGGPGFRGTRHGMVAALADVWNRRAHGVLVLSPEHLSWQADLRVLLAHLVTEAGGFLYIADGSTGRPGIAAPTHYRAGFGNGERHENDDEADDNDTAASAGGSVVALRRRPRVVMAAR